MAKLSPKLLTKLLGFQRNELTEHLIYQRLAKQVPSPNNQQLFAKLATDELRHYHVYRKYTNQDVKPNTWKVFLIYWCARFFGFSFVLKLMEKGEERAKNTYLEVSNHFPEIVQIIAEEDQHEHELLNLLEEEGLRYVSSIVLGLNDALVELTGTLAGLTFALQNTRLTALSGLITGVAASFSMGASEYLSTKTDGAKPKLAFKSALYTWIAYVLTVIILILPYLLLNNYLLSLLLTLMLAVGIILVFNFYIAVAKNWPFWPRFLEMTVLSVAVAVLSFVVGYLLRIGLGVDV